MGRRHSRVAATACPPSRPPLNVLRRKRREDLETFVEDSAPISFWNTAHVSTGLPPQTLCIENKRKSMAGTTGLEPATSDVTGRRSNQLSYVPAEWVTSVSY